MGWKDMEWKEVLKFSLIVGVISSDYVNLGDLLSAFGETTSDIINIFAGIVLVLSGVATGLILNRKLSRKSNWGVYIGMTITWLTPFLLVIILTLSGLY